MKRSSGNPTKEIRFVHIPLTEADVSSGANDAQLLSVDKKEDLLCMEQRQCSSLAITDYTTESGEYRVVAPLLPAEELVIEQLFQRLHPGVSEIDVNPLPPATNEALQAVVADLVEGRVAEWMRCQELKRKLKAQAVRMEGNV